MGVKVFQTFTVQGLDEQFNLQVDGKSVVVYVDGDDRLDLSADEAREVGCCLIALADQLDNGQRTK